MALERQPVAVPLRAGVDTRSDPKQLPAGKLETLENGVFSTGGQIDKRAGFAYLGAAVPGGFPYSTGALLTHKDQLIVGDGQTMGALIDGDTAWSDLGRVPLLSLSQRQIARGDVPKDEQDSAIHSSGATVFAWREGGNTTSGVVKATVIDTATGAVRLAATTLDTAGANTISRVKALALGDYVLIFWVGSAGTYTLYYKAINVTTATPTVSARLTIGTMESATSQMPWDGVVFGDVAYIVRRSADSGATPQITLTSIDTTLTATSVAHNETAINCIGIGRQYTAGGDKLAVAWDDGAQGKWRQYNLDLTAAALPAAGFAVATRLKRVAVIGADLATYAIGEIDATKVVTPYQLAGTATSGLTATRGVYLAGKPFVVKPRSVDWLYAAVYVPVFFGDTSNDYAQASYFIVDLFSGVVAKALYQSAGAEPSNCVLPEVNAVSTTSFKFAAQTLTRNDDSLDAGFGLFTVTSRNTGVNELAFDFKPSQAPGRVEVAGAVTFGGGVVREFDGARVVEQGFHVSPDHVTTPVNTGSAQTYNYLACYEWTDAQGNLHRSAPCIEGSAQMKTLNPIGSTVGPEETVTVTAPSLRLTDKTGVQVAFFRTKNVGTTFYRAGSVANDKTTDTVSFTDDVRDSQLAVRQQLYCVASVSEAGVQQNTAPPAGDIVASYRGRALVVDALDPLTIWFSKTVTQGWPLEFATFFTMTVDEAGGDITGLGVLDDRLIVFKADRIFYITGQGPTNTGADNDFSDAKAVPSDVGCVNHRSVVAVPAGLMFQSARGIYLLDRSMNVSFVGSDVEALTSGQTVTSALLMASENQVRFALAPASPDRGTSTTTNTTLVFDYLVGQWSVFLTFGAGDAVIYRDRHTLLSPDGTVYRETPGTYLDSALLPTPANSFISLRIKTGWLNLAALQGFQRLWRVLVLGDYASAHRLNCRIEYDYDEYDYEDVSVAITTQSDTSGRYQYAVVEQPLGSGNYITLATWTVTTIARTQQPYQYEFSPAKQKCEAARLTLYDTETTVKGESMSLSALALLVGAKRGTMKLPASKRMT